VHARKAGNSAGKIREEGDGMAPKAKGGLLAQPALEFDLVLPA
jgi:hypothetical protein